MQLAGVDVYTEHCGESNRPAVEPRWFIVADSLMSREHVTFLVQISHFSLSVYCAAYTLVSKPKHFQSHLVLCVAFLPLQVPSLPTTSWNVHNIPAKPCACPFAEHSFFSSKPLGYIFVSLNSLPIKHKKVASKSFFGKFGSHGFIVVYCSSTEAQGNSNEEEGRFH